MSLDLAKLVSLLMTICNRHHPLEPSVPFASIASHTDLSNQHEILSPPDAVSYTHRLERHKLGRLLPSQIPTSPDLPDLPQLQVGPNVKMRDRPMRIISIAEED